MGVEIQNKIINEMLTGTANDMRLIAAKLIPYMMMKGHVEDICRFNDFIDSTAGLIESNISNDNKKHFIAPTILDDHIDAFLFNLGMCLCKVYSNICESCPDYDICQRKNDISKDQEHCKVISIHKEDSIESVPKKPMLDYDQIINLIDIFCDIYRELEGNAKVQSSRNAVLTHIEDVRQTSFPALEKCIKILTDILEFLRVLKRENDKHQEKEDDDNEFL